MGGTVGATRVGPTFHDVATAEAIEVGDEVAAFFQSYIDTSRCPMRPVWPGLQIPTSSHAVDVSPGASSLAVKAVRGKSGEPLAAGIVGPRTKVDGFIG